MKKKNLLMTAIAIFGFATVTMAQNQLGWGTYYTATQEVWPFGEDVGKSCITDASGNVYMVGYTSSAAGSNLLATSGAHQSLHAGGPTSFGSGSFDAYLVKFNSSGVRQWATYYGGSGNDFGFSCATDASGNVFMIGITSSTSGIATAGAHETAVNNGFLVKFNSSGVRQWGTYFGGNGKHCTTDASGNIYIVGETDLTSGIATAGTHQTINGGYNDAFLVKFDSNGLRQWGTYYGGSLADEGNSCAIDALGNIYMTGFTQSSTGIATAGAVKIVISGVNDAYLVKFDSNGVRQSGTYYGGGDIDIASSCATDASGNIYMTGQTQSNSGIATAGAHQTVDGGVGNSYNDAFLVKFNAVSVGITEVVGENLFTLYPNPTRGLVNVKTDSKLIGSVYSVYDNMGKVILSGKIYTENTSVDMGNLSAGIYLFSVGENVKQTFKVIKE